MWAWPSPSALGGVGLAPGIGIDVDDVAVFGEAVDESHDASGTRKDGAPLLVRQVGGDDGGFGFVPTTDDVVQEVGRATVAGKVAKLVDDQDMRRQIALAQAAFGNGRLDSARGVASADRVRDLSLVAPARHQLRFLRRQLKSQRFCLWLRADDGHVRRDRQKDIQLQHVAVTGAVEIDRNLLQIDVLVLGQDCQ